MKFTCQQKDFADALSIVERGISVRSTLPITNNILIESEGTEKLRISSNNLDMGLSVVIAAEIKKTGAALAPAKTFAGVVLKIPEGPVDFDIDESYRIRIEQKQIKFTLNGASADDFPQIPGPKGEKKFSINPDLLALMIRQTIFAVSMDENKANLNSVFFEVEPARLSLVATDGFRLALRREAVQSNLTMQALVPARTVMEVGKILTAEGKKDIEEVLIIISPEQVAFYIGNVYIVSRLLKNEFPKYQMLIPQKLDTKAIINREAFLSSAERTVIIASNDANIVRIETFEDKFRMSATTTIGEVSEIVTAQVEGIPQNKVAINIRLLIDILRNLSDDEIMMSIPKDSGPCLITALDKQDKISYIIMPIRTNS